MVFKNEFKNIQAAAYNGARRVGMLIWIDMFIVKCRLEYSQESSTSTAFTFKNQLITADCLPTLKQLHKFFSNLPQIFLTTFKMQYSKSLLWIKVDPRSFS